MIDDFEALEVFLSLTQTGSVQATADELDLTAPNVSRKLAKLEHSIGRKLFDRTRAPQTSHFNEGIRRTIFSDVQ